MLDNRKLVIEPFCEVYDLLEDYAGKRFLDNGRLGSTTTSESVMGTQAFTKTGNTVTFLAATTAPTAVQAISTTLGGNQYRIINAGSVTVFLGYGADGASANSNAAVITTTGASIPLLPGTDEILSFVPNAFFTGITVSSNATIYVTPGDGS